MASSKSTETYDAQARYRVRSKDVLKIECHRARQGREEFLVHWKGAAKGLPAVYSWHALAELTKALDHVQAYIETLTLQIHTLPKQLVPDTTSAAVASSRKRKAPGDDVPMNVAALGSHSTASGLVTPSATSHNSDATPISISSDDSSSDGEDELLVYNGKLERKAGRLVPKPTRQNGPARTSTPALPTEKMMLKARQTPINSAHSFIREAFEEKLRKVPKVRLENYVDDSTPSLDFTFITEFQLREGTYRVDEAVNLGCQAPCRPDMGQGIGCEYSAKCECLEYAAVDEQRLSGEQAESYERGVTDTSGLPKRFPYKVGKGSLRPPVLQKFYRESRHPIYECNLNCACGPVCKTRLVQKGRKVPLTIFKTANGRGWGVYCDQDLLQGEFVDTYLGEVITNEEATRREEQDGHEKNSYLYNLDKFAGDDDVDAETCFVVDGQAMGNVTRFVNHCCEPNLRQFTVSYHKHDLRIYELAFFAVEDIPAYTELTFDYMDKDEEEEEVIIKEREAAMADPANQDKVPCNCGAPKCRGYLWV